VLQCVAVCCSMLQCVAVCCSVLQCVAVCCSVLQCVAIELLRGEHINMIYETYWLQQRYGICVLQGVAVGCD